MDCENFVLMSASEFSSFIEVKLRGIIQKRKFVHQLEEKIRNFEAGKGMHIIILYGLRGTGKTVGLLQIASKIPKNMFFLRGDELLANKIDINEVINALDKLNREKIGLKNNYILLIDEITYLKDWILKIKVLHDKRPNLLIILTSSSSLALAFPADMARRSSTITVTPLTFREYLLLKHGIEISDSLSKRIFENLIEGKTPAEEFFKSLAAAGGKSLSGIFEDYMHSDMPLSLCVEGEEYFEGMKSVIKKIVYEDFTKYGKIDADILPKAEQMIFFLSQIPADGIRIENLSNHLALSKETVVKLLGMFEKSLIIKGLEVYGRRKAIKMPRKWMFTSPSIRYSLSKGLGLRGDLTGNLREDSAFLHLSIIFSDVSYSHEADFIIPERKLAFEVGGNKPERKFPGFNVFTLLTEEAIEGHRIPLFLFALAF